MSHKQAKYIRKIYKARAVAYKMLTASTRPERRRELRAAIKEFKGANH